MEGFFSRLPSKTRFRRQNSQSELNTAQSLRKIVQYIQCLVLLKPRTTTLTNKKIIFKVTKTCLFDIKGFIPSILPSSYPG